MSRGGLQDGGYQGARGALDPTRSISAEIEELRSTTPLPHFPIAVVVDVINDPSALTPEDRETLKQDTSTPELVDRMPRNSIIGRIITRGVDKSDSTKRIFFPSKVYHQEPLKPGEQVFIFYSDPYRSQQIGYWWMRVPEPLDTDDINFTHGDRRFEFNESLTLSERAESSDPTPPGFLNGDGSDDTLTLADRDAYESIRNEARANEQVVKEPVARFTKRPGDTVIQGSNGARMVFGMDRTGAVGDTPTPGSPTIDIVATRYELPADGAEPEGSAPRVTTNARDERETEKNPLKRNAKDNPNEGDPDFSLDDLRVYLSALTNADENFSIEIEGVEGSGEGPAIVLKTDQIRMVARKDLKIQVTDGDGIGFAILITPTEFVVIPPPDGIIKLGGRDADKGLLCNLAENANGKVVGTPTISTFGGAIGIGNPTQGFIATKILVK